MKGELKYKGSLLSNVKQQNKSLVSTELVTYQKGNSIYIVPYKQKIIVPEVCLFFRNKLMRGCRIIKYSASNYEAFVSPNLTELGTADEHIVINEKIIRKVLDKDKEKGLVIDDGYSPRVMYFTIAPGMDINLLETILTSKNLDGIILLTYGTGNAPTLPEFLTVINKAINLELCQA